MTSHHPHADDVVRNDSPSGYARMRALLRAFLVVGCLAVAAALTGLIYMVMQAADQSDVNGELLKEVQAANARLIDCTTPDGICYKEGQDRTASAIVGINEGTLKVIVAAIACQEQGYTTEQDLARCTVRLASD